MKRKRPRVVVIDPKDLERRCAAAKAEGRRLLSRLDPEQAQALAFSVNLVNRNNDPPQDTESLREPDLPEKQASGQAHLKSAGR